MIAIKNTIVTATIVYELDPPKLFGMTHSVDRVIAEYSADSDDEDEEPYLDLNVKGWRLTSKMTVDKRQTERESISLTRKERAEYVTEDLGINYVRDLRDLLRTPFEV